MHLHLSIMTLMTISIISKWSSFPYIFTRIGRGYSFNCAILNSLFPWMMFKLNPHASYLSSTMSSTVLIWAVGLDLHGLAVTKFNFAYLVARKGHPLTKNISMYNCTYLWCSDIGNVGGMRFILSDFGWYLVILHFIRGVTGS